MNVEQLESLYGPLWPHSDHKIGDQIQFFDLVNNQVHEGTIEWIREPETHVEGGLPQPITYVMDIIDPSTGFPFEVFPSDIVAQVEADTVKLSFQEEKGQMMNLDDFNEALDPKNWQQVGTTLHTATFQATIKPDGTLWMSGPALREGFSVEATQALTRFLSEHIKLPPQEPPDDLSDYTPERVI